MFTTDGIEMPDLTNHDDMVRFVKELLERYEAAQAIYSNKEENKSQASVKDVLAKVQAEDEEAVLRAENAADNFRSIILAHVNANPNVAVLLFPIMQELTKVVGSYRAEATVTVTPVVEETDEDRDLLAEYTALEKAQTMITGSMMMGNVLPSELPAKFTAQKSKRVDGKNVPTGELTFKFPGQLRKPNEEGSTSAGRTATSENWLWEIEDRETGSKITIGKCSIATLARLSSSTDELLSFSDLKERLDNRNWMEKSKTEIEFTVPRGILYGKKVTK